MDKRILYISGICLLVLALAYTWQIDRERESPEQASAIGEVSASAPPLKTPAGAGDATPEARGLTVEMEGQAFRAVSVGVSEGSELALNLSKPLNVGAVYVYLLAPDGRLLERALWPAQQGQLTWTLNPLVPGDYLILLGSQIPQKVAVSSSHPLSPQPTGLKRSLQGGVPLFYVLDHTIATKVNCTIATSGKGQRIRAELYSPEGFQGRYEGDREVKLGAEQAKQGRWLLMLLGRFSPTEQVQFTLSCPQQGVYRTQAWELHPLVPGGKEQAVYSFELASAGSLLVYLLKPQGVSEIQAYLTYSGGALAAQSINWDINRADATFYLGQPPPGEYRIILVSPVGQQVEIYAASPEDDVRGVRQ